MTPSKQQAAFYDFIINGTGSCVLEAVAGAGKTTTLVEALRARLDPRHHAHRATPEIQKSLEQMRHYLEAWVYPELDALLGRDSMPPQHKKRAR